MQNQPTIQTNQPAPAPTPAQTPAPQPTPYADANFAISRQRAKQEKHHRLHYHICSLPNLRGAHYPFLLFGAYYDYLITFMTISVLVPLALSGITAALGVFLLIYALAKNAPNRFCIIAGISIVTSIATLVIFRFFLLGRYA